MSLATLVSGPVKELHRNVPIEPDGRIYIQSSRGSLDVTAWDRSEVEIDARVQPRNFLASQRACVTETDVRVDSWPRSVRITPEYAYVERRVPRVLAALLGACTDQPQVHYRIKVPRMSEVVIVSNESRVSVKGLAGRVEVRQSEQ